MHIKVTLPVELNYLEFDNLYQLISTEADKGSDDITLDCCNVRFLAAILYMENDG